MTLLTLVNFLQPYLLEEVLQIPRDEQGALTGFLAALQEIGVISLMGLVGALSDRTGRRVLFALGFVIIALGYFLYPAGQFPGTTDHLPCCGCRWRGHTAGDARRLPD